MAGGFLAPLCMFWLYVWEPLRPYAYPKGNLFPQPALFLAAIAGSIALWWLPRAYFRIRAFEQSGRLYESLGVRHFRRFVPDGEIANSFRRRTDPQHKMIRNRTDAAAFIKRTEDSERGHLVFLGIGILSALYAWHLGWNGWAAYLTAGNVVANVYPILLQRYTRARLERLARRSY